MTLGDLKKYAVKLIDEYSDNANITDDEDIREKLNGLFNIAQFEMCQIDKIKKTHKIVQDIPQNEVSPSSTQDALYTHNAEDIEFTGSGKSYYFQVKGSATITIKQSGMSDITLTNTDNTGFTTYKGLTSGTGTITIVFGGDYYYTFKNVAIFNANYQNTSDIPNYERYVEYTLPNDYYQLNNITYKGDTLTDYKKENNKLMIPSYYEGEIVVNYYGYPTTITDDTEDTFTFELSQEGQMVLPYYVASDILKSDVSADYTSFEAKYNAKLEIFNATKLDDNNVVEITKLF